MAAAYSCQITIHNLLKQLLTLSNNSNQSLDAGSWQLAPPETILDNEEGTFYSVGDSSNGKRSLGTSGSVLKTSSWTDLTLEAKLHVKYNRTLITGSHATSVTIPASNIAPHILNEDGTANSINVKTGSNFVMWQADSLAEYEDNSDSFVSGSRYPVAVDINDESFAMIELRIDIADEMLLGVPLKVHGDNDVEKEVIKHAGYVCFHRTGERTVPLKVAPSWARKDVPWGVAGNIVWRFRVAETAQALGLNSSRLEFYALNRLLPSYFNNEVPVTLARRFILPRRTWPQGSSWERYRCFIAFYDFLFQYDIKTGRSSYGYTKPNGDVNFRLLAYLSDIGKGGMPVNCYDQACIMFVSLALSPVINSVEWMYMNPFGLIKTTVLIGRGACNNPFYVDDTDKICDNPKPFGNHAFVRLGGADGTIADACAGPHAGRETLQQFIDSSIDKRRGSIFGDLQHARPWNSIHLDLS